MLGSEIRLGLGKSTALALISALGLVASLTLDLKRHFRFRKSPVSKWVRHPRAVSV